MKKLITNYTFSASNKQITFSDYVSGGIELERVLAVMNVTRGVILYNFADPNKGGTVASNILTLEYNTTAMANTDDLMIYYDDEDALLPISHGDALEADKDSITVYPVGKQYKRLTASGIILGQPGILTGAVVTSTTSGIIKIFDNASTNSGNVILNNWEIPVGAHVLPDFEGVLGLYMQLISGSIDITFGTLAT